MVMAYALACGLAGLIFFYIGVSMGWLYTFMGVILGSAVVPIALCITWKKANKWGCIGGSVIGFAVGLIAWLVTTSSLNNGIIDVVTSGGDYEMLAGNLASIGVGGIIAVVASYVWPEDYDWAGTRAINVQAHRDSARESKEDISSKEKEMESEVKVTPAAEEPFDLTQLDEELDPVALNKAFRFASISSLTLFVVMILLIPLPLFFASTIYTVPGLTAWVAIGIAWVFCSIFVVVLYPLYESRAALAQIGGGIIKDIFANGSGKYVAPSKGPA